MREIHRNPLLEAAFMAAIAAWALAPQQQGARSPAAKLQQAGVVAQQASTVEVPAFQRPDTQPAAQGPPEACGLLLVAESDEKLLAIAAPVAAKMSRGRKTALLAVTSGETLYELGRLMQWVGMTETLLLRTASSHVVDDGPAVRPRQELIVPEEILAAGLELAKRFWGRPEEFLIAPEDDGQAGLLGSALAAHRGIPFLLVPRAETGNRLARLLQQVGARRVSVIVCGKAEPPAWVQNLSQEVKILDHGDAQAAIIRKLGPGNVRNVIVVRAPNGPAEVARASWLAPYLSYARKSVIVVATSHQPEVVEAEVAAVVSAQRLRPRTVTILADHGAVGIHTSLPALRPGEYPVDTEPCSRAGDGGAAAYGVGRIPFSGAARASLLIARGLSRERPTAGAAGGVLMVANPRTESGTLPLAETIARLNVEEFRNFRVPVSAYFGVPSDGPDILALAGTAGLIVYQGHISDQAIFRDPGWQQQVDFVDIASTDQEQSPSLFARPLYWLRDQSLLLVEDTYFAVDYLRQELPFVARDRLSALEIGYMDIGKHRDHGSVPIVANPWAADSAVGSIDLSGYGPFDAGEVVSGSEVGDDPTVDLRGSPMVILQSCNSLWDEATSGAILAGASGVIGSVTSIHSASGSSFVKAWSDAVLYRGATAGEAMRDARNYFLLLAGLKGARGHKEQAKVLRVAMSFHLWGDPEVVVLPGIRDKPTLRPITGKLRGRQVTLKLPGRKLPEAKTSKYVARVFPGSQTAGIVKRLKGKDYRRLMPTYFLRLDRPAGLNVGNWRAIARSGDFDTRAVFSTDSLGRYIYVLYFPDEEKKRGRITLEFAP